MSDSRVKTGLFIILAVVLGVTVAVGLYFYQIFYKSECFLPGVKIASVSVAGYTREEAAEMFEVWVEEIYRTPVIFSYEDYTYKTRLSELCFPVEAAEVVESLWKQDRQRGLKSKILNLDGSKSVVYSVKISYRTAVLNSLIEEWNRKLASKFVNARLEVDREKGLVIIPGTAGKSVNAAATLAGLPGELKQQKVFEVPIVMEEEFPEITEEDLQNMGKLSSYTTWYDVKNANRSHNLELAASAISASVIAPGNIFSFNRTVGERIYEKGYRDALVIQDGQFKPGTGGGICQVSSTLYNACLLAGFEIVERHNHALAVAYVPLGRDATVVYGQQDFRFKNNTGDYVYIHAVAGEGRLTVNIYGNLDYKKKVELSHVIDEVIGFKEVQEIDNNLKPGEKRVDHEGFPGYVVRTFRAIYDTAGQLIEREQLALDRYKPLDKLTYIGPPQEVEPVPPEDSEQKKLDNGEENKTTPEADEAYRERKDE